MHVTSSNSSRRIAMDFDGLKGLGLKIMMQNKPTDESENGDQNVVRRLNNKYAAAGAAPFA